MNPQSPPIPTPPPSADVSDALGIHQSDIIIRTALLAALQDMRSNPYLLDYCFAGIKKDALTSQAYSKEVLNAKKWFLKQDVRVVMATQMNSGEKLPCISIELTESVEADENTLGDIHYFPVENLQEPHPDLCSPFTPTAWDPITGTLTLPSETIPQVDVEVGMVLVDRNGKQYPITEVFSAGQFSIEGAGPNTNLRNSTIRGSSPSFRRHMESASFRESYTLGIHTHGEPVYLTYLHSIVVFCLLRYREVLLEGRGFERSHFSSTDQARNAFFDKESVFSRYISISGYVRQYWPKLIVPRITSVLMQPKVGIFQEGDNDINIYPPLAIVEDPSTYPDGLEDASWIETGDVSSIDTSDYAIRGNDQSPGAPVNGPPDGAEGPAVMPTPNGQMDSALQNLAPDGTPFGEEGPEEPAI